MALLQAIQRGDDEPDDAAGHGGEGRDPHVHQGKFFADEIDINIILYERD